MADYELLIKTARSSTVAHACLQGDMAFGTEESLQSGMSKGARRALIDATGSIVAPGFMDIHTPLRRCAQRLGPLCYAVRLAWRDDSSDRQLRFRFCSVRPEERERAMRRMERTETIPLSCMQAGMRWDWVTFPEFLDSLDRGGLGVNAASSCPTPPARLGLGNEAARDPNYKTKPEQVEELKPLVARRIQAGGFGFSASFSMANRDYDGGYLPTQVAPREEFLEMAKVMREFNRGSIEWTMGNALQGLGLDFLVELSKTSGRPVNWNAIVYDANNPNGWRRQLEWTEKAYREAVVLPVDICLPIERDSPWNYGIV